MNSNPAKAASAVLTRRIEVRQVTCAIGAELGKLGLGETSHDAR